MLTQIAAHVATDTAHAIHFVDLGLSRDVFVLPIGSWHFALKWYSVSYIAAILLGWWYLLRLIAQPGAPMARRHADDFIFYATIGIILGGRLGYVLFYKPDMFQHPQEILMLWNGGMSFHGGLIGIVTAMWFFARRNGLTFLRVMDYVGCVCPIGVFLVRCANFVNGELWGRQTDVPWGMVFPDGGNVVRHPSQLYEAGLEGLAMGLFLWVLFWRTDARYYPGRLAGAGLVFYSICRFALENVRQPDAGLEDPIWGFHLLTMGQVLSLPVFLVGLWLLWTSGSRRHRVEPIAGTASVA